MFSICKQTHSATGVEHAISCYFLNRVEKCLVTAGANILKIFKLVPDFDLKSRTERYSGKFVCNRYIELICLNVVLNVSISFIFNFQIFIHQSLNSSVLHNIHSLGMLCPFKV